MIQGPNNNNNQNMDNYRNNSFMKQQEQINKTTKQNRKSAMDYKFGKVIGEGSYSTVYLAKEVESGKEFAIKVCDKDHILREKKQDYVKREREALHQLIGAPGFVSLACTFQDPKKLYFVTTYANNGELLPYINKVGSFDLKCTKFYAAELLLSIEEMHKRNIIHRDLKPENLLLDRNMHLLVADLGSSRILPPNYEYVIAQKELDDSRVVESNDGGSDDDIDHEVHQRVQRIGRSNGVDASKRKNSFVGTAQYVAPEILKANMPHLSTDLWSYGCIIYQMISGLPPFRGATEFLIFQKVVNVDFQFPDGFDEDAKDLIKKLLCFGPLDRIGSADPTDLRYLSIRNHPFFSEIDWDNLRLQAPPKISPYLPGNGHDEELRGENYISDVTFSEIEPGLGARQMRRLLQLELGTSDASTDPAGQSILSNTEQRFEAQRSNPWSSYVENCELIIKFGFVNKRKGLFSRRRMLLLTSVPRLIYIDASANVKKGEIPFTSTLTCEPKNFKVFFVHTPNRTYYLEDPEGFALEWCKKIEEIRDKCLSN